MHSVIPSQGRHEMGFAHTRRGMKSRPCRPFVSFLVSSAPCLYKAPAKGSETFSSISKHQRTRQRCGSAHRRDEKGTEIELPSRWSTPLPPPPPPPFNPHPHSKTDSTHTPSPDRCRALYRAFETHGPRPHPGRCCTRSRTWICSLISNSRSRSRSKNVVEVVQVVAAAAVTVVDVGIVVVVSQSSLLR